MSDFTLLNRWRFVNKILCRIDFRGQFFFIASYSSHYEDEKYQKNQMLQFNYFFRKKCWNFNSSEIEFIHHIYTFILTFNEKIVCYLHTTVCYLQQEITDYLYIDDNANFIYLNQIICGVTNNILGNVFFLLYVCTKCIILQKYSDI